MPVDSSPAQPGVEVELGAGVAFVRLVGEHDLSSAERIVQALTGVAEGPAVVMDLSDCTFIDSTVIKSIVDARRDLEARHGQFELVIPPSATAVRRVIQLTALDAIFTINESRDAALARLARDAGRSAQALAKSDGADHEMHPSPAHQGDVCPACKALVLPHPALPAGDAMTRVGTPRVDQACPACGAWVWYDGQQWQAAEPN